jgi:hypothetical protein
VEFVEFEEFCGLVYNVIKSTIFGKVRFRPRECPNDPRFLISRNPPIYMAGVRNGECGIVRFFAGFPDERQNSMPRPIFSSIIIA